MTPPQPRNLRAQQHIGVSGLRFRGDDLPADTRLAFDAATRRTDGGLVLIGGSPLRILRVSEAGAAAIDEWEVGTPVGATAGRRRLARRLLDGGLAHPRFAAGPFTPADVTCIVPVHDRADRLEPTLEALRGGGSPGAVIVVDDASNDAVAVAEVASRFGASYVRRDVNGGPAAARNAGLAHAATTLVAFVDRDVEPEPGWLDALLVHLADERVAVVAPRIRAAHGPGVLARFEHERSPLDLGAVEARVVPGSRVSYVPTTALLARRTVLADLGGFDESLRVGEDVDLVWRIIEAGHIVRYEPGSIVRHPVRTDLASWMRQRFDYGTSAAPLDSRHPGSVAPLSMSGWTAAAWAVAAAGHPLVGAVVAAGAAAMLPRRLTMLEDPWRETWALAGTGQLAAWRPVSTAVTRTWWPAALGAALVSRRARRTLALAAVVAPIVDWTAGDHALDPIRYTGLRILDDVAYGAGVWTGCRRSGSFAALRPTLRSWPGRGRATPPADASSGAGATASD